MSSDWLALLPLLLLTGGGTMLFMAGAFWPQRPVVVLPAFAIVVCLAAAMVALFAPPQERIVAGLVLSDGLGQLYTLLLLTISVVTVLFAGRYAESRGFAGEEFWGILLFATAGMAVVTIASHWLSFFLGLELLSISLYLLIAMRRGDPLALEAAVKYFMLGAVASAFVAFGIACLYAATGTLEIQPTFDPTHLAGNRLLLFGLSLLLVGLGFKISLVPFHLWTPDVYQGAPAPVAAFLATGSKVALLAVFVRLALYAQAGVGERFAPILWGMAALTMVIGNLTALKQTRLKRLLAYSSIAQMGYMLMALLAVRGQGAAAVVFSSLVYAFMDLGAFGAITLLSPQGNDRDTIDDYRGLGYSRPGAAALLALCLFALAGMPATGGFIAKFVLFRAAFQADFVLLGLLGLSTAIVALYYYLRVVVVLYMHPAAKELAVGEDGQAGPGACLVVALAILALGLVPGQLLTLIAKIVGTSG